MCNQIKGIVPKILILASLFSQFHTFCQEKIYPAFEVVKLERGIGYGLENLNREIKTIRNKEELRKLIKSKNFPPNEMIIRIKHNQSSMSWLRIDTRTNTETESDIIVLQSKNTSSLSFNKLSDFKLLFKDTLVLLENLYINLYIHDDDYPDDQYKIAYSCDSKIKTSRSINLKSNFVLKFDKDLLGNCENKITSAEIFNSNKPGRNIASFHVVFLNESEKENLVMIAAYFKKFTSYDFKTIVGYVSNYCQSFHGSPLFSQLSDWLGKRIDK